ncbi:hypothetical protein HanPSC8_Chr10g0435631 [Helianthus annuus]|nr:hypothetical protein HanPSC8_Chr10g0435631 [Helianthus annuus]
MYYVCMYHRFKRICCTNTKIEVFILQFTHENITQSLFVFIIDSFLVVIE